MFSLQQTPAPAVVRTFIDLRRFEQDHSQGIRSTPAAGEDRFLASRRLLDFPPGPFTAGAIALEALSCGVWDSTAYHRRAMYYPHYELMYLLAGSVAFVDGAGRSGTFLKGDIFMVEQHAQCSWESREVVAKVFALYRPAA